MPARSSSLPEPTSISARPHVACGTKRLTNPSPRPSQARWTCLVTSVTRRRPGSIVSTSLCIAATYLPALRHAAAEPRLDRTRYVAGRRGEGLVLRARNADRHAARQVAHRHLDHVVGVQP